MIKCDIGNCTRIEIDASRTEVDICIVDENGDRAALYMTRNSAELLLTSLLESLNKIERRV